MMLTGGPSFPWMVESRAGFRYSLQAHGSAALLFYNPEPVTVSPQTTGDGTCSAFMPAQHQAPMKNMVTRYLLCPRE